MSSLFKSGDWFRLALSRKYEDNYKEGVHFVRESSGEVDDCEQELHSRLRQALAIRTFRQQKEQPLKEFREAMLPSFGRLEAQLTGDLYLTDGEGLVGEILAEIMAERCFSDFRIIYRNWRRTGHSNREGMDLIGVWNRTKREHLVLIDSKFCGGHLSDGGSYVRQTLTRGIDGVENWEENEVKLGKAFKWTAEEVLQVPTPLEELAKLYSLFDTDQRVGVVSITVSRSTDFGAIINTPPKSLDSCKYMMAFSLLDFVGCTYITKLVETTVKPT